MKKLFLVLALAVVACGPKPPDVPACEHMGQHLSTNLADGHLILTPSPTCMDAIGEVECGHCVFIMSGKEIFVGEAVKWQYKGKPWSLLRQQSVMLPAQESYAPLAAYVINACKQANCSSDVDKFKVKLDSLKAANSAQ